MTVEQLIASRMMPPDSGARHLHRAFVGLNPSF